MNADLRALIEAELRRPAPAPVVELARQLAARAKGGAAAVLFYGSALRDGALGGVLDFYVLVDHTGDWPGSRLLAAANRVLPPNVGYLEQTADGQALHAKYAVMTLRQFRAAMRPASLDTTLWARFSQPSLCIQARSAADFERVVEALTAATCTAAHWAAVLGPEQAPAADFWRQLYAHTYQAELRVERSTRGTDLVGRDTDRYTSLLPACWTNNGLPFETLPNGQLQPALGAATRRTARRRWSLRRRGGKPLNLLRLLKAATTFDNAADYVAWKIERHSGYRLEPTDFQRRHPLLAAPGLYWRLKRAGVLR